MPQLVVESSPPGSQTIELLPGVIRLGRHPENDHCLDDTTVSSRHCEITVREGSVRVRDLGSTNGTLVDGQRIQEAALLPGQTLHVGAVKMKLVDAAMEVVIPTVSSPPPAPFLPDGAPACFNHSSSHATMECLQCHKMLCELCVHQIRRVGGKALKLCPSCGGHCRPLVPLKEEKKRKSRISSWIGKVTAKMTARIPRSRKR